MIARDSRAGADSAIDPGGRSRRRGIGAVSLARRKPGRISVGASDSSARSGECVGNGGGGGGRGGTGGGWTRATWDLDRKERAVAVAAGTRHRLCGAGSSPLGFLPLRLHRHLRLRTRPPSSLTSTSTSSASTFTPAFFPTCWPSALRRRSGSPSAARPCRACRLSGRSSRHLLPDHVVSQMS